MDMLADTVMVDTFGAVEDADLIDGTTCPPSRVDDGLRLRISSVCSCCYTIPASPASPALLLDNCSISSDYRLNASATYAWRRHQP